MKAKMKRHTKALLALALSVMMVAELWGGVSFVSQAVTSEPESVTVGTKFPTDGSELAEAEYYITTVDELEAFVAASADNDYSGKTIHLAADIDYAGGAWAYGDNAFLGSFNGHGYTISNVAMTGKGMFTTIGAGASVKNFKLNKVTLTVAELANRVGIIAGTVAGGSIEDCTILDSAVKGTYSSTSEFAYSVGGAFGAIDATEAVTVSGLTLNNVDIQVKSLFRGMGGVVGYVTGSAATTFTDCSVLGADLSTTNASDTSGKENYHLGGFAGCADAATTFTNCSVDTTNLLPKGRTYYWGGLLGSSYSVGMDSATAGTKVPVTISKCSVEDVTSDTVWNRNCNFVGGIAGYLTEGVNLSDCYVYGFNGPSKNVGQQQIGGIVGRIETDNGQATTVKNCFVTDTVLKGRHSIGEVIGQNKVTNATLKNLAYYNCTITRDSATANPTIYSNSNIEEITYDQYANGTMAYAFNVADGGNTGIWTIKDNTPCFAEGTDLAPVKVVFRGESGTKVQYTNSTGVVDPIPEPDEGYVWVGVPENGVFTENTWIFDQMIGAIGTSFSEYDSKPSETDYYISTPDELVALSDASANTNFAGVTIHLANDIDMAGVEFYGIGMDETTSFCGTFDGHGYTISNLTCSDNGMFNCIGDLDNQAIIKNFTLDQANVSGTSGNIAVVVSNFYGILAASNDNDVAYNNQIVNVTVQNSTANFSGDDCGIIAGRFAVSSESAVTIDRCKVINTDMINTTDSTTDNKYWGMLIGRDESTGLTRMFGCEIIDSDIITTTCNLSNSAFGMGRCTGATRLEDCVIDGCTFTNGLDKTGDSSNIGGFAGQFNSGSGRLTDCKISNTTFTFEGGINYVGGLAGRPNGGTYTGNKVTNVTINANKANGTSQYGRMGGAYGASSGKITISDTVVKDVTINQACRANTTAGLIGEVGGGSSGSGVVSSIKNCTLTNINLNENYKNNAAQSYSYGGVAGALGQYTSATFQGLLVDGLNITMNTHVMRCGGILGYDRGTEAASRYQDCIVNNFTFTTTQNNDNSTYEHKLGGIVGVIENTSPQFHTCTVNNFNINTAGRARYIGGILGKTENLAQPKLYRCTVEVMNVVPKNNRNINNTGGIAGNLVEGSTMTNCYVSGYSQTKNGNNDEIGGLVGSIADHADVKSAMYIKNSYVQNFTLISNKTNISQMVGKCAATDMQSINNWYYNAVQSGGSGTLAENIAATEVTDTTTLTDGTLAWILNTENDTNVHSGSWAQGETNPIIANSENRAYSKIKFQGINSATTLITRADGTVDESQIPTPDEGFVWRMEPGAVFTKDTTIPLQPEAAEDVNADGFYRVDDLVRAKKAAAEAEALETVRNKILNPNPTDEVKVMNYNIYWQEQDTNGTYIISNRLTKVKNLIGDYVDQGYGVIGLQEVRNNTWHSTLTSLANEKNLAYVGYGRYGGTFNNYSAENESISLIAYDTTKYSKVDEGHFWFSDTPSVQSKWNDSSNYRVANWVILKDKTTNKEFFFINAHMEETAPEGYTKEQSVSVRRKSADLMAKVCRENAGTRPVIAVGDWNSYSGQDGYSQFTSYGYKDVRLTAEVNQDKVDYGEAIGSYNAFGREDVTTFQWGDHITMSPWCYATYYNVLDTEDLDADTGYHFSDHCPIIANINM